MLENLNDLQGDDVLNAMHKGPWAACDLSYWSHINVALARELFTYGWHHLRMATRPAFEDLDWQYRNKVGRLFVLPSRSAQRGYYDASFVSAERS